MKKILIILTIIAAPWWLSAQTMTIGDGAVTTIGVGASITTGSITNTNNAGLVIESDANGSGSIIAEGTPNATVERYIDVNAWHLVTPITNPTTAFVFYTGAANQTWLASHDAATNDYTYITDINATLDRGRGYTYWIETTQGAQTVEFTGTLIGEDVTPSMGAADSWNLIGNPFPAAIDWTQVPANHISGTAYVWDNGSSGYLYSGGTLPGDIIPMGQGFFVQVKSGFYPDQFKILEAARVHDHTNGFLKSANADGVESTQFVRLDLNGGYYGNTVFVGFPENGTADFDISGDATKLYSSTENVQFFALENEVELCKNANEPLAEGESKTVPLNMVQVTDGEYTLAISDIQLANATVTLEDLKTGTTQNLQETPVYTFNATSTDNAERFLLHFAWSPDGVTDDIEDNSSNLQIYAYGNEVYIRSTDDAVNQNGNVFVYDLMGRELTQQKISGTELIKFPVNIADNYVIVRVVKAGSTTVQKVYIK